MHALTVIQQSLQSVYKLLKLAVCCIACLCRCLSFAAAVDR